MNKNLILELTLRPVSTADAEDTSGYALQQGSTTPATSPIGPIAVPVAIRLSLPGPAPERPLNFSFGEDVQGFQIVATEPENVGAASIEQRDAEDVNGYLYPPILEAFRIGRR